MSKILVIGSLNVDLVSHVPYLPKEGETISSTKFQTNFGGKGANQALAVAKLGGDVSMIGKVGKDEYGDNLIHNLKQNGVDTSGILVDDGRTGMAFINVSSAGENNIVLVPGANHKLQKEDIKEEFIKTCDKIIMQLEIPLEVVEHVLVLAEKFNKEVILNPAPAKELSSKFLAKVHTIIPNETELHLLSNMPISTEKELVNAATYLLSFGIKKVIVTAGENGSYIVTNDTWLHVPACKVEVVDTTAAGDSFIAAFVVASTKGMDDIESAKFATRVSGVVVTKEGAQSSIPTFEEVESYFKLLV